MADLVKIGVIGAGKFGGYHAGKCAAHPRTDFVGVFDTNQKASQSLSDRFNVTAFEHVESLIEACDAVVIAAPATFHGEYARQVLSAGRHALIEKPMATTLAEAEAIVGLAKAHKVIVQVGHQERFVARAIGLDKIIFYY